MSIHNKEKANQYLFCRYCNQFYPTFPVCLLKRLLYNLQSKKIAKDFSFNEHTLAVATYYNYITTLNLLLTLNSQVHRHVTQQQQTRLTVSLCFREIP